MRQVISKLFFASLLCAAQTTWAVSLINRPNQINGDLLPKGLWMVSYDLTRSDPIKSQYNSYGEDVSFLKDMAKTLSVSELLENVDDPNERALARAAFGAYGIQNADRAGTVRNDLKLQYSAKTFVLGYGATDTLSFLFAAPNVRLDMKVESHIDYSSKITDMVASLREQGQLSRANEIEARSRNILEQQFDKYNYDDDYISSWEGVPNFYMISRWAPDWLRKNFFSIEGTLILPNESDKYQNQFMPVQLFEESPSFVGSLYYSQDIMNRLRASAFTSFQIRTRFRKDVRVPEEQDSPFSDDRENVRVQYGNEWATGIQTSYLISNWLTPYAGVTYRQKESDSYRGDLYEANRYRYLEKNSRQHMSAYTLGASFNSVDAFLKNKFLIPAQVTVSYSDLLSGENVFSSQVWALNFMVFYKNL